MANHPTAVLMKYGGLWHDVTADVSQNDPIKVTSGQPDYGQSPRPSKIELTFEDRDGVYRPYRADSPLYGLAGRNTPLVTADPTLFEGFESATLGITVSKGTSTNGWARSATSPHTGGWCFKSGTTANSATSDAIITPPAGANMVMLWYRTDCASGDTLTIISGGTTRVTASGTGGTWQQLMVPIFPDFADPTVILRYTKDASGTAGADAVYVDDLQFFYSRAYGEINSWEPDQTLGFQQSPPWGRRWTAVTAGGLLARIGGWTDRIQSAMTRTVLGFSTLTGFWPGEDGREATLMNNLVPLGASATAAGVTFADSESPGGGDVSVKLSATTVIQGQFLVASTTAGWQVSRAMKLDALPSSATYQPMFSWTTSNNYTWTLSVNATTYLIQAVDDDGNLKLNLASGWTSLGTPTGWVTMRLSASASGGTVSWALAWYSEGATASEGVSGTFSGSVGRLNRWKVEGNAYLDGASLAYVYGVTGTADNLLGGSVQQSFNGFAGERALTRFSRLMGEQGISYTYYGFLNQSQAMGPQRPDTLINLLVEIRDTDGGMMYDDANRLSVTYRALGNLVGQSPKLALTFETNVAQPIKPVLDNQDAFNVVTAEQRDGGSVTVQDDVSAMGTLPPPAGIGVIKETVDVNVADEGEQLTQIAYWWLGVGTVPDARYPTITVDLDANPEIEATARAVRPGDRITVSALDPDLIDMIVLGKVDNQQEQKRRTVVFTCSPFRQYLVALYDSAAVRYDSASTATGAAYGAGAASIVFRTTSPGDLWSTTETPYDVFCLGERFTVTTMGAATGSGPYNQTAAVTRAVNGISKALPAGSPIHVANPGRYGL